MRIYKNNIKGTLRLSVVFAYALAISAVGLFPLVNSQEASAAQLTSRRSTITTSAPGATGVNYNFEFTVPSGGDTDVEGLMFEFCQNPLGPCTLPDNMDVTPATVSIGSQSGFPANGTAFAEVSVNTGDCNVATDSTKYCVNRTEATQTSGATALQIQLNNITNPTLGVSDSNRTVYVRISLYNNSTFTGPSVHEGTVAASINRQLVVSGRVQERLELCVAAVEQGDPMPANCSSAPTNVDIDLGVIDNLTVVKAPVLADPISGANDAYGIAMLNTNASNGATVQFSPVVGSGTEKLYSFRVNGAVCDAGASLTDQCFESAPSTGDTITNGQERFGMAIGCILAANTTTNLGFSGTAYNGNNDADCANTGNNAAARFSGVNKFAWETSANPVTIAESSSVVDNEVLHLTFAATASPTTPTGFYSVTSMYIATPTF
jgi:hypothetical protein